MPRLRVEYAKSGRSKCALPSCARPIARHAVRVGTAFVFPTETAPADDAPVTYKWRHLCCFTARQLQNAAASGDLAAVEGVEALAPADRALVEEMKSGALVGKNDVIDRIGDVANSPLAEELMPKKRGKAKGEGAVKKTTAAGEKAPTAGKKTAGKRMRDDTLVYEDGAESDATDEYDVDVIRVDASERPPCPYGKSCFRTGADHFLQYSHGDERDENKDLKNSEGKSETRLKAVIKGTRHSKGGEMQAP